MLRRLALFAWLVMPLLAQQVPSGGDREWIDLGEAITLRAAGDESAYTLDVEKCPGLDADCIVLNGSATDFYLTYSLDAKALRGQRIRFSASLLVENPPISRPQLFVRVDRTAGVGFHEYTKASRDDPRGWTTRELIGSVDDDAKQISVGLRFAGSGVVYLASPRLEKAAD